MESQSNDSSSDGDTSPDTEQSNQFDSESQDETTSSEFDTRFMYLFNLCSFCHSFTLNSEYSISS